MVYIQITMFTSQIIYLQAGHATLKKNYHLQATGCISNLKKRFADAQRIYTIPFIHFTKTAITLLNNAK